MASQSQVIAEALDAAPDIPVRVVWKPVLTDAGRDPAAHASTPARTTA